MASTTQSVTRLCRLCRERPVPASRLKWRDYRCTWCRHHTPAYQNYERTPERIAANRVKAAMRASRRIHVGSQYHSMAKTAEQASLINAHIKERLRVTVPR